MNEFNGDSDSFEMGLQIKPLWPCCVRTLASGQGVVQIRVTQQCLHLWVLETTGSEGSTQ